MGIHIPVFFLQRGKGELETTNLKIGRREPEMLNW